VTARSGSRLTAVALALGVFASGVAAGIAVDRLLLDGGQERQRRRGPPTADDLVERYQERLELDPGQTEAVRVILRRRMSEADAVFDRVDPEMDAIRRRSNEEVRAVLRADQHAPFDQIIREQEERRAAIRERRRPPPR
jgi:hypothetical protein